MSLATPTTATIADNIVSQIEAAMGQSAPLLPKAFIRVLGKVLAGVFVLLYKYAGWMSLQSFVSTASFQPTVINGRELTPLIEWGRLVGVGDPTPATAAELLVSVTVDAQGGTLPAGSQLLNADNGVTYVTTSAVALNTGVVQVTIRAAADQLGGFGTGAQGNLPASALVSFANPLSGVARPATVISTVTTGSNAEGAEDYRQRVLDRFQKRPQGGALADYERWAEAVPGVVNAYPYAGEPGEVDIYLETDAPEGLATPAQRSAVLAYIGDPERRPLGSFVNVYSIFRTGFDVTIEGLTADDTVAVQGEVEAALEEYFLSRAPFIEGLTPLPRRDQITRTAVGAIIEGIAAQNAASYVAVNIARAGLPVTLYYLEEGEKAKLGSATWL